MQSSKHTQTGDLMKGKKSKKWQPPPLPKYQEESPKIIQRRLEREERKTRISHWLGVSYTTWDGERDMFEDPKDLSQYRDASMTLLIYLINNAPIPPLLIDKLLLLRAKRKDLEPPSY